MRELADAKRVQAFMRKLGAESKNPARVYFTGGATAVLLGWRPTTIDLDVCIEGEEDPLLRCIPRLKEELRINVELASPPDFIPELPGWRERSIFVTREGKVDFFHFDPYSQALAKIERGHSLDRKDVREMIGRGLVDPEKLGGLFQQIEPELFRYPAIDPKSFRRAVEKTLGKGPTPG